MMAMAEGMMTNDTPSLTEGMVMMTIPFGRTIHPIAIRGEMLNLTDMWKASGGPSGRGPADWLALTTTKDFIEHVELIAGNSGNKAIAAKAGRYGSTTAHWQIGLAYAKYFSREFHIWHAACQNPRG